MDHLPYLIALDIDGPIINGPLYFLDPRCSLDRSLMNTQAIAYVVKLAQFAGAKIVCNSTHNNHDILDPDRGTERDLKSDLIRWGVPEELFHSTWRTKFPQVEGTGDVHPRQVAIDDWLTVHGDHDWIAFDDEPFDETGRQILIDFDRGIDQRAFRQALKRWDMRNRYGFVDN